MSKIRILYKDNQIFVKSKLDRRETIDERELQVLSQMQIYGVMFPEVQGRKKLSYRSPAGITLHEYLAKGIRKKDFTNILFQIAEITKKIECCALNLKNMILNVQYTFINEKTKEIYFIYQPIKSQNFCTSIFDYLNDVVFGTVFQAQEDMEFINDFIDFIKGMNSYSAKKLENYLRNVCPELYGQQRGHSRETGDGEETTLLEETTSLEKDTEFLEEGGTMLLEEGTTLLENAQTVRAHLVRSSNYDRVDINKPVFRIGKEKSYVDYFVANNNAVSRIHADIVKRGESFYIKDNNSTNHTFVNGKMIDKNEEIEIFDGDAIMLANEGFEFHICG